MNRAPRCPKRGCGALFDRIDSDGATCAAGHFIPRGPDGRLPLARESAPPTPAVHGPETANGRRAPTPAPTAAATAEAARPAAPRLLTASDLLALNIPPLEWIVPGLLPAGLTLLAGRPKLGKSWLALGLAVAVATGGRALGEIPVPQGDVLVLALEDGERRLQARLRAMLGGAPAPERLALSCEWPTLDRGGLNLLAAWLDARPGARLAVIDTFVRVRGRTVHSQRLFDDDYLALTGLARLATARNVAIVAIVHTRKAGAEDVLDTVQGTSGVTAACDAALILQRARGAREATLAVIGRDLDAEREYALIWDEAMAGWRLAGEAAARRQAQERAAVLALVAAHPDGLTPTEAAALLGRPVGTLKAVLWRLAQAGDLRREGGRYAVARPNASNATLQPCNLPHGQAVAAVAATPRCNLPDGHAVADSTGLPAWEVAPPTVCNPGNGLGTRPVAGCRVAQSAQEPAPPDAPGAAAEASEARGRLLTLGQRLGWPRLALDRGVHVAAGREAWARFVEAAPRHLLPLAVAQAEAAAAAQEGG